MLKKWCKLLTIDTIHLLSFYIEFHFAHNLHCSNMTIMNGISNAGVNTKPSNSWCRIIFKAPFLITSKSYMRGVKNIIVQFWRFEYHYEQKSPDNTQTVIRLLYLITPILLKSVLKIHLYLFKEYKI